MALFMQHHIPVQEGPAICLQILTDTLAGSDENEIASASYAVTKEHLSTFVSARTTSRGGEGGPPETAAAVQAFQFVAAEIAAAAQLTEDTPRLRRVLVVACLPKDGADRRIRPFSFRTLNPSSPASSLTRPPRALSDFTGFRFAEP